jgi:hypothetical protein
MYKGKIKRILKPGKSYYFFSGKKEDGDTRMNSKDMKIHKQRSKLLSFLTNWNDERNK